MSLNVQEGKEWKVKKAGTSKVRTDRIWRYSENVPRSSRKFKPGLLALRRSISRSKSQTRSVAAARNKQRALSQLMSDRSPIVSFPGITGYGLMLSFVSLPIDFIQNGFESEGDHTERERKTHTQP